MRFLKSLVYIPLVLTPVRLLALNVSEVKPCIEANKFIDSKQIWLHNSRDQWVTMEGSKAFLNNCKDIKGLRPSIEARLKEEIKLAKEIVGTVENSNSKPNAHSSTL